MESLWVGAWLSTVVLQLVTLWVVVEHQRSRRVTSMVNGAIAVAAGLFGGRWAADAVRNALGAGVPAQQDQAIDRLLTAIRHIAPLATQRPSDADMPAPPPPPTQAPQPFP